MSERPSPSVVRVVRLSVVTGYGLTLAGGALGVIGADMSLRRVILDVLVVVVILALPPTLALFALPDRPLMLLAAGLTGGAGLYGLGTFGIFSLVLGLVWLGAYVKLAPPGLWWPKLGMALVPILWLGAGAALWLHLDPACEQRLRDGTVVVVDPAARGFESGWVWEVGNTFSGGSGPISPDVVYEACTSNHLVLWEAGLSLVLAGAALAWAWWLAGRARLPSVEKAPSPA